MSVPETACPQLDRLDALLRAERRDPDLLAHLSHCSWCQRRLSWLVADRKLDAALRRLRDPLTGGPLTQPRTPPTTDRAALDPADRRRPRSGSD